MSEVTTQKDTSRTETIGVFDPESGFRGRLFQDRRLVGEGTYKSVEGDVWVLGLPNGQNVNLGTVGTPVTLRPRVSHSLEANLQALKSFRNEKDWLRAFQELLLYDDQGNVEETVLKARTIGKPFMLEQQSMPFAQSLEHALNVLCEVPDEILNLPGISDIETPRRIRQFLLLAQLTKGTRALEHFHNARYAFGWNGESQLVHGDAGQWHLNNYMTSANSDVPQHHAYRMIDPSFAREADQIARDREKAAYSRQVLNYFASGHNVLMLDADVMKYIHTYPLSSQKLAEFAAQKLGELSHQLGTSLPQTLSRVEHQYFLAYLFQQVKDQTRQILPPSAVQAIYNAIVTTYPDQITATLPTMH